jgi:hypothetical protein
VPYIPRNAVKRPKPVGRPPLPIPEQLREILDETFTTNQAYTDDITDSTESDLQELRRMGERHAARRGLSFRMRITNEDEARVVTFWLQVKNKYQKRAA